MTAPPLPASPCLRVKLDYNQTDGFEAGSRFYLSYAGAAPTAGNCVTLAGDVAAAWATHMSSAIDSTFTLVEVDVLDIASLTGASGTFSGTDAGGDTSGTIPAQCAANVEFNISRRYRGGKPRIYWPPPGTSELENAGQWSDSYVTGLNTDTAAFFNEITALSIGAMGALAHVNLSYYSGFKNITNSSGRERAVPTYRDTALVDVITGYAAKKTIGSQKRRRRATTY